MLPNREGRFKATILEHGVSETGPNRLATFVCRFQLTQELADGEWTVVDEDFDITGYFYLEKKDGSLNSKTIESLKAAFGWDGRDPFWLQDQDFTDHVVQVKLAFEQYDGRTRIKVQYVDEEDATPTGVPQADDSVRRSIANRLGAKFRANAGGSPSPAPKPAANSRPTPPARPAVAPPQQPTMQDAWEAFTKTCPENAGPDHVEAEWFRLLGVLFPGKQAEELTAAEWKTFISEAPSKFIPF